MANPPQSVLSLADRFARILLPHRCQMDATDREIDRLVYDLYGLTKEEIAIVEGANSN